MDVQRALINIFISTVNAALCVALEGFPSFRTLTISLRVDAMVVHPIVIRLPIFGRERTNVKPYAYLIPMDGGTISAVIRYTTNKSPHVIHNANERDVIAQIINMVPLSTDFEHPRIPHSAQNDFAKFGDDIWEAFKGLEDGGPSFTISMDIRSTNEVADARFNVKKHEATA